MVTLNTRPLDPSYESYDDIDIEDLSELSDYDFESNTGGSIISLQEHDVYHGDILLKESNITGQEEQVVNQAAQDIIQQSNLYNSQRVGTNQLELPSDVVQKSVEANGAPAEQEILAATTDTNQCPGSFLQQSQPREQKITTGNRSLFQFRFMLFNLGVVALLICQAIFMTTGPSAPSHARVRQIDIFGQTHVIELDLFTSKGVPFLSKGVHIFHVRILDSPDELSLQESTSSVALLTSTPTIRDLGNGTYRIYSTALRMQKKTESINLWAAVWSCSENSRLFLHLWFNNGTRVPGVPQELSWPQRGSDSALLIDEKGERKSELDIKINVDEDGDFAFWRNQMQLSVDNFDDKFTNLGSFQSPAWDLVQPTLCGVVHGALSLATITLDTIEAIAKTLASIIVSVIDLFGGIASNFFTGETTFYDSPKEDSSSYSGWIRHIKIAADPTKLQHSFDNTRSKGMDKSKRKEGVFYIKSDVRYEVDKQLQKTIRRLGINIDLSWQFKLPDWPKFMKSRK
ncbi:hypothetical protein BGZ76_007472 [Entomortierella beljakovae]|nr:hypothetical protein BGZ76_007472 [Entomortierella beljakovae]